MRTAAQMLLEWSASDDPKVRALAHEMGCSYRALSQSERALVKERHDAEVADHKRRSGWQPVQGVSPRRVHRPVPYFVRRFPYSTAAQLWLQRNRRR